ncbi:hypothetical protein O181_045965 [Austropuccinia psidii MF-1]|uniref:Reverse transcriptase Ty1/copia-type domain-containing protein n=1 Tax=Austropuccinia psidii MF-1 TaxID=1389203 RepID=A0A9Q3DML7_9BASI|nr:hypothetical protein [Austropuccinia psidii MF-1]
MLNFPHSGKCWIFYDPTSRRIFQASSAVFLAYQALPRPLTSRKGELNYIVNNLHLGKVSTSDIAEEQDRAIRQLPVTSNIQIPKTLKHTLNSPFECDWRNAAMVELNNFKKRDVWEPTSPSKEMKVLGGKWVFDIKQKADGTVERLKARYVGRGFSQRPGVDCFDIYAPAASLNSLRLLLALKVKHNFVMAGFDVSAAYLYSPIQEDVYVQAPVELLPELNSKVMRIKKALYGTKQVARYQKDTMVLIVWIHVNDRIVIGNSTNSINDFKTALMREVDVQWQTKVEKIVGLHIINNGQQIEINQKVLIDQYLSQYPWPIIPQYTTMSTAPLVTNASVGLNTTNYQSAIGTLMYISGGSRPDITYAVHMLARFASCPDKTHWLALDHLTGYLLRHRDKSLRYTPQSSEISLWVDASWGGEHARSTSGFVVKAFGNPIAWNSRRKMVVAMSTCAAEYVALSDATQLLAVIRLIAIQIDSTFTMSIKCDNCAAIMITEDNLSKKKTKYLDRAFYFVNDFVRQYNTNIDSIPTINQHANALTKPLGSTKLLKACQNLNLSD